MKKILKRLYHFWVEMVVSFTFDYKLMMRVEGEHLLNEGMEQNRVYIKMLNACTSEESRDYCDYLFDFAREEGCYVEKKQILFFQYEIYRLKTTEQNLAREGGTK